MPAKFTEELDRLIRARRFVAETAFALSSLTVFPQFFKKESHPV